MHSLLMNMVLIICKRLIPFQVICRSDLQLMMENNLLVKKIYDVMDICVLSVRLVSLNVF